MLAKLVNPILSVEHSLASVKKKPKPKPKPTVFVKKKPKHEETK